MPRRKPKVGGARAGAGRRPLGALKRSVSVQVLLTPTEGAALDQRIKAENAIAASLGLPTDPPITVSSWVRGCVLEQLGIAPISGE